MANPVHRAQMGGLKREANKPKQIAAKPKPSGVQRRRTEPRIGPGLASWKKGKKRGPTSAKLRSIDPPLQLKASVQEMPENEGGQERKQKQTKPTNTSLEKKTYIHIIYMRPKNLPADVLALIIAPHPAGFQLSPFGVVLRNSGASL